MALKIKKKKTKKTKSKNQKQRCVRAALKTKQICMYVLYVLTYYKNKNRKKTKKKKRENEMEKRKIDKTINENWDSRRELSSKNKICRNCFRFIQIYFIEWYAKFINLETNKEHMMYVCKSTSVSICKII